MQPGRSSAGHPVDVASGTLYASYSDYSLRGRVMLTWQRHYSSALLQQPTSPLGPGWTTRYFATLTREADYFRFVGPDGGQEIFPDPEGLLEAGGTIRNLGTFLELNKSDNRYTVTSWDVDTGDIERYVFKGAQKGSTWPLASIEDATGQGVDLHYDRQGQLNTVRQRREGRAFVLHYNRDGLLESVGVLAGNLQKQVARYEYNESGQLVAAYNALGHADRYAYDGQHRMTREIGRDGGVFHFRYDAKGRCIKTSGQGRYDEKTLRFLDHIGWSEVTDSLGAVWRFQWTPAGQVTRIISPLGAQSLTQYDEYGRISVEVDPKGGTTRYRYDETGNLCEMTNPLGHVVRYEYNARRQTTRIIDAAGQAWERQYDDRGYMVANGDPLGNWWRDVYDDHGDLISVQNPRGAIMQLRYSASGDEIEQTDWEGRVTRYEHDAEGRVIKWSDPQDQTGQIAYDAMGHIRIVQWPDGSIERFGYDAGGNRATVIDGNGQVTQYRYGHCGLLQEKIDALGSYVTLIWSTEPGQLLELRNENGEVYRFEYDEDGQLVKEIGFDGVIKMYAYDLAGYCVGVANALGEKTILERDAVGRVIRKLMPDGTESTFTYDPLGYMVQAHNATCALEFEYDVKGQLIREDQAGDVIEWEYDALGNQTLLRTSRGLHITYEYDANSFLKALMLHDGQRYSFSYNELGSEELCTVPGWLEIVSSYDPMGRLAQRLARKHELASASSGRMRPFSEYRFRYDQDSNLVQRQVNGNRTDYRYDSEAQLLDRTSVQSGSERFSYDAAGNIVSEDGTAWEYSPGNRLQKANDIDYHYDVEGHLICKVVHTAHGDEVWRYAYNGAGELETVEDPSGIVTSFAYDPLGRRITKHLREEVTRFLWNGDVPIHEIRDRKVKIDYVFKPDSFEPIVQVNDGIAYTYILDHVGVPQELMANNGRPVWSADYSAWGKIERRVRSSVDVPFRFQGQYFDPETGLHYNRFRYYDPETGRYISPDPIGLEGGINLYRYGPNPTWWVDPFGLDVTQNKADGNRREEARQKELQKQYPDSSVQRERYLRDSSGKIVRDLVTGEARRVDLVVIDENGSRVQRLEEVTSPTADKRAQAAKEGRIRARGGEYVRDKRTGKLVKIGSRQRIHCTRMA